MGELANYLASDYLTDRRDREEATELAELVVAGLAVHHSNGVWPYLLNPNGSPEVGNRYSYSTNAMILHSLAAAAGPLRSSAYVSAGEGRLVADLTHRDGKETLSALQQGLEALHRQLAVDRVPLTKSPTYGDDDPLTCGLLLELDRFTLDKSKEGSTPPELPQMTLPLRKKMWRRTRARVSDALSPKRSAIFRITGVNQRSRGPRQHVGLGDHAFPLLCLIRMAEALLSWVQTHDQAGSLEEILQETKQGKTPSNSNADLVEHITQLRQTLRPVFQGLLFQQLASSNIPSGEFDAAELALSLEGLLICGGPPHRDLVQSVFDTLQHKQLENPYWRPTKPFQTSPEGRVLLPISIEIANSLLRSCYRLDTYHELDPLASHYLTLFRAYWKWLLSRKVQSETANQKKFVGWNSEHASREGLIHLWDTSQVLLFLVQYSGMLRRHIGRRALLASRLLAEVPRREAPLTVKDPVEYWGAQFQNREPLLSAHTNSPYCVYQQIRKYYIRPHAAPPGAIPRLYSILLYGPPGTGKSGLAKAIAESLHYRLVTVTTSDFLAGGPGEVEGRAKDLFEALLWQYNTVILFDEIDHFILDRESRLYREQTGIFQFMTPGMLTKIKALRDTKRPIFLIATNYRERIDRAIRRKGRIDQELILLPPNSSQRLEIIKSKYEAELRRRQMVEKEFTLSLTKAQLTTLIDHTRLWVFGELIELINQGADAVRAEPTTEEAAKALVEAAKDSRIIPTLSLSAFESRFNFDDDNTFPTNEEPFEEFYLLVYLACEREALAKDATPMSLAETDKDIVRRVVRRQTKLGRSKGLTDPHLESEIAEILDGVINAKKAANA